MNEDTFLAALHEDPCDEVTWLALADWLEDDGQSDRAELVRLPRQLRTLPVMKRTKKRAALEDRLTAFLNAGVRPVVPEITNSIGMRLAMIPPGRFRMGSPRGEEDRSDDETLHEVEITQAFYLGIFSVTQAQYQAVVGSNPSFFNHEARGHHLLADVPPSQIGDFPVDHVSWEDAQAFLRLLNESAREEESGLGYRLPSEAEWEYACRAGACCTTAFHTGATLTSQQANYNCNFPPVGAEPGPFLRRTSRVGSYMPNAFGLHDMHGNVWDWCQDWYGEYPGGSLRDPFGAADGMYRVFRGGAWYDHGWNCRAAIRGKNVPNLRQSYIGFRIAASPSRKIKSGQESRT